MHPGMVLEAKSPFSISKNKLVAISLVHTGKSDLEAAKFWAKCYSTTLGETVKFIEPNEPILLITQCIGHREFEDELWFILAGEKIGWIHVFDWMNLKRLKADDAK